MNVRDIIEKYTSTAPVNIEAMIRSFGIELDKKAALDSEIAGQIEYQDGTFKISVNARDFYFRQRFTMAHELGHFLLHKDLIGTGVDDTTAYRSTNAGKFFNINIRVEHETQANRFAASILMPAKLVQEIFTQCQDVGQTAKVFQVSPEAMRIRLETLKLI